MKKASKIWQRVMALALVLMMVLSYMPTGVVAEGENAGTNPVVEVSKFSATLIRTLVQAEVTGENDEVITPALYTYQVIAGLGGEDVSDKVQIKWYVGADTTVEAVGAENTVETVMTAVVMYDGLELKVSNGTAEADEMGAVWGIADWNEAMSVGIPVAVQLDSVSMNANSGGKVAVSSEVNEEYVDHISAEGVLIPKKISSQNVEIFRQTVKTESGVVVAENVAMSTISWPELNGTFTIGEKSYSADESTEWYTESQKVQVQISNDELYSANYLPKLIIGGVEQANVWTADTANANVWTTEATVDSAAVISVGSERLTVNIDGETPQIINEYAYKSGEKVIVCFEVAASASPISSVKVANEEQSVVADNKYQIELEGYAEATVKVEVAKGNGMSADKEIPVQNELAVSIKVEGAAYATAETIYYDADTTLVFTVVGAGTDRFAPSITVEGISGVELNAANNWTQEVTVSENYAAKTIKLSAKDTLRTAEYTLEQALEKDEVAPVIGVPAALPASGATETVYVGSDTTYEFSITDNVHLKEYSVTYSREGKEDVTQKNEMSIDLIDGDILTGIKVSAKDDTGNAAQYTWTGRVVVDTKAPEVSVAFDASVVKSIIEISNGYFILLNAPTEDSAAGEDITVVATVTVTDDNIDPTSVDGWTVVGKAYVKEIPVTVKNHQTDVLKLNIAVKDMNGKTPEGKLSLGIPDGEGGINGISIDPNAEGAYVVDLKIDRRYPSGGNNALVPPEIKVETVNETGTTADGLPMFKNGYAFKVTVKDSSSAGQDSGVETLSWYVDDGITDVAFADSVSAALEVKADGVYNISGSVNGVNETNTAKLFVTAEDKAGNKYTYEYAFSVDNKAPQITVSYDNNEVANEIYYKADRKVTVTFTDLNIAASENIVMIDGQKNIATISGEGTATFEHTFTENGEHTFSVAGKDVNGNETSTVDYTDSKTPNAFILDKTPPQVTVTKNAQELVAATDTVEYYNDSVTYTITFTDDHYKDQNENVCEAYVEYTVIHAGMFQKTKSEIDKVNGTTIELTDGMQLADMTICVVDDAGNPAVAVIGESFEAKDGKLNYSGRQVAVDNTDPVVTVQKTVEEGFNYIQSEDGKDYYNGTVTYRVTVTDNFLSDKNSVTELIFTDENGEIIPAIIEEVSNETSAIDRYVKEFTVKEDVDLTNITICVKDNAGNEAKVVAVTDPHKLTTFTYNETDNIHTYSGRQVVVDKTKPVISMQISEEVKGFYTKDGQTFAVLDPEVIEQLADPTAKDVTVILKVTVEDNNLSDSCLDMKKWTKVENSDIAFYQEIPVTIQRHQTNVLSYNINVYDLVGWTDDDDTIIQLTCETAQNQLTTELKVPYVKDEGYVGELLIDRRTPSSEDVTKVPEVSVTAPTPVYQLENGTVPLYNSNFSFGLKVHDKSQEGKDSGISTIVWELNDGINDVGFLDATGTLALNAENTYVIPVNASGEQETNNAVLTVTVTDNVGNQYTYRKNFAFDNRAPRVTVSYDNNEGWNGTKYFKANRTATIKVEDINFNAGTTAINTEVKPTDWAYDETEGKWICSCSYTADGNYTFAMESTDLAKIYTADDRVTYVGLHPKDFVIDKTAPVITVTYNPSSPVGKDNEGVDYYADELNATVSIREVNFNARDVDAKFNSNNSLSGFSSSGNTHTARETFSEGNRYQFSVNYTDLAGNAAVGYNSPVFSVDLTAPTIEITEGTMTNDKLNIVQEDMVLGFTINDAQSNLKNYGVKVTHLNNEFKTEEVEGADYYSVTTVEERTTVRVNFANIAAEKGKDGIYTVQITAQDYAGNTASLTPELLFSLNRFGSTFYTDDPFTQDFLVPSADGAVYQQLVGQKLIFKEINPNQVWQDGNRSQEGSVLTIVVNGTTRVLTEGVDYTVSVAQEGTESTKWYVYTYEVDPAIFADGEGTMDGRYSLLFYSEDEAGNKNTNESNEFGMIQLGLDGEYTGKVEFTLDDTTPIISTVGIESEGSYDAENQKLSIFLSDNTPVSIFVKLNSQSVDLAEAAGANNAAWLIWDDAQACYVLNVPEQNTLFGRQNVEIKVTDAAGNIAEAEIADFTVSSNLFVRFVNSIWFWVVCAALILLVLLIIVLVKRKQKKGIVA